MPVKPLPSALGSSPDQDLHELLARAPSVVGLLRRMQPPPGPIREAFEASGLGPRHSRVLIVVCFRRELSVTAVAEHLDVSLPAASLLIGELDRAGLLTRVEDSRDRRRTLVRIHQDYEDAADEWLEARAAPWRATLARLSPRERQGFLEGWRILHSELDASQ